MIMDLHCEYIFPFSKNKEITVGDVFYATCSSPPDVSTVKSNSISNFKILKQSENEKYTLKLISTENQDNKWVFKFTSYQVGPVSLPGLVLEKDKEVYNLGSLEFKVNSILNPQEKTEPFGPFAGIKMEIPILYWTLLVFLIFSMVSGISSYFILKWKRKKLLEKLEDYETSTSALQQFYATHRKVQRENPFFYRNEILNEVLRDEEKLKINPVLNELESALKLFLVRKFKTPALSKNWNYTLNDLQKYHGDYMSFQHLDLKDILREIEKARSSLQHLTTKDMVQISEKIRLFIEFSEKLKDAIDRKDRGLLKKLRSLKV